MLPQKKAKTIQPSVNLLGCDMERVDSIKYLGLTIRDHLYWSEHISKVCTKARRLFGMLFRHFYSCAETSTIRILYLTLIRPHLEYANQVWDPYLVKDCKMLGDVQKFACKVCLKNWNQTYDERRSSCVLCTNLHVEPNAPILVPLIPRSPLYDTRYTHSN